MIKLCRGKKPKELTDNTVRELTEEFKKNKNARVWDKSYIRDALFSMSHGKCCYCERKLGVGSEYFTVDHYHHKNDYPDEVVEWENLLPCCSLCNSTKRSHDTYKEPIIDPTKDNPREYLYFQDYRYKSRVQNGIGRTTIDLLPLNDYSKVIPLRFDLGNAIHDRLEDLYDRIRDYDGLNLSVIKTNKIRRTLIDMLVSAGSEKEYSALTATIILEDNNYTAVKDKMKEHGIWNDELTRLENAAKNIYLSKEYVC